MASDGFFTDDLRLENAKADMKELKSSAASIHSTATANTLFENSNTNTSFIPGRTLLINSRGHALTRLPLPSSELEILICNPDGTPAYISTRGKRSSGDAVLSSPKSGHLISTSYFFGPMRDPVIRRLGDPDEQLAAIKVSARCPSRTTRFTLPDGSKFEWSYIRTRGADKKKVKLLVLDKVDGGTGARRRLAQLRRDDETRTPGTSKTTAGNGGELLIDQNAYEALEEPMIVVTCLLMLKKEVDRRRLLQFMVVAGVVSGGS
ncbi:hypothetical protein AJ80_00500 [Polytolypa hystricis UAMH7299]|uniref:Uncharacterized protein n=1 Tax=Polytolypa hystricis (strain UAMH7299) TaxID=1447883 RepID=A0A2B7Z3A8_POLH7|nr:hypothetical protein AJ80_00500 [Polytolypa hystricis UAMH7299]